MNNLELNRPIMIGCCPSSGSTLLSVILDAHLDIFCGPEVSIFSHPGLFGDSFDRCKGQFLDYLRSGDFAFQDVARKWEEGFCAYNLVYEDNLGFYKQDMGSLGEMLESSPDFFTFAEKFYGPLLLASGKRIWSEKSPSNLYAFGAFLKRYPKGRVVYLVRDGRDVICSLLRRGFGFKRAVSVWLLEAAICESHRNHPRVFQIRYEDLVEKPREVVVALLEFLEVAPTVEAVLNYSENSSRITTDSTTKGMSSWTSSPRQPISPMSVGRWREMLTPEQLCAFYTATIRQPPEPYRKLEGLSAAALLKRLGYKVAEPTGVDGEKLLELIQGEILFASGAEYVFAGQFQERFVECDPDGLPEAVFSWQAVSCAGKRSIKRLLEQFVSSLGKDLAKVRGELAAAQMLSEALDAKVAEMSGLRGGLKEAANAVARAVRKRGKKDDG